MYQTFLSRALVAVAVTGGAFLLGRVLAHTTAQDGSAAAEECEVQAACPSTACTEDCRYRGLPDAPALPAAEPEAEAPLVIAADQAEIKSTVPPAVREDEVIVIPAVTAATETVESTAVLCLPNGEVPSASKPVPAFMPYIDDEPVAAARKGCLVEEFFGAAVNDPSEEAEAPAAPAAKPQAGAQPEAKGMPSISRYLKPNPAQVDTMEFRPTDARRGDFQPRQL